MQRETNEILRILTKRRRVSPERPAPFTMPSSRGMRSPAWPQPLQFQDEMLERLRKGSNFNFSRKAIWPQTIGWLDNCDISISAHSIENGGSLCTRARQPTERSLKCPSSRCGRLVRSWIFQYLVNNRLRIKIVSHSMRNSDAPTEAIWRHFYWRRPLNESFSCLEATEEKAFGFRNRRLI
jgi:hypothetical protein